MRYKAIILALLLATVGLSLLFGVKSSVSPVAPGPVNTIVFVTIDTLRADHLPSYGYPRDTAPFLERLARAGVRFENAFSAAPHTAPSHTSMFTGLFPFQHGVLRNYEQVSEEIPHLFKLLAENGWNAAAFPAVGFLDGRIGFPKSPVPLQLYDPARERRSWYLNAEEVIDNVEEWFTGLPSTERTFLWVHLYDVHQWKGRRHIPERYLKMMEETGDEALLEFLQKEHNTPLEFFDGAKGTLAAINGYDARLRFVDDQLARLERIIASRGAGEGAIWVVTSDHGEGLGNHNYEGHGQFLYQEQLHVPLIVYSPENRFLSRAIPDLVRTVDLYPTLLNMAGIAQVPRQEGVSLLPLLHQGSWSSGGIDFSFAERRPKDMKSFRRFWEEGEIYSIHDHDMKLIDHSHGEDELYNLQADKFELSNIAGTNDSSEDALREELRKILARREVDRTQQHEVELDPQQIEELKSLGYL